MIYLLKKEGEEIHVPPYTGKAGAWCIDTVKGYTERIIKIDKILKITPNHMDKNIFLKERKIICNLINYKE